MAWKGFNSEMTNDEVEWMMERTATVPNKIGRQAYGDHNKNFIWTTFNWEVASFCLSQEIMIYVDLGGVRIISEIYGCS